MSSATCRFISRRRNESGLAFTRNSQGCPTQAVLGGVLFGGGVVGYKRLWLLKNSRFPAELAPECSHPRLWCAIPVSRPSTYSDRTGCATRIEGVLERAPKNDQTAFRQLRSEARSRPNHGDTRQTRPQEFPGFPNDAELALLYGIGPRLGFRHYCFKGSFVSGNHTLKLVNRSRMHTDTRP